MAGGERAGRAKVGCNQQSSMIDTELFLQMVRNPHQVGIAGLARRNHHLTCQRNSVVQIHIHRVAHSLGGLGEQSVRHRRLRGVLRRSLSSGCALRGAVGLIKAAAISRTPVETIERTCRGSASSRGRDGRESGPKR